MHNAECRMQNDDVLVVLIYWEMRIPNENFVL